MASRQPIAQPLFHSSQLKAALSAVAPDFEAYKTRLDKITSDIKNLEEYIRASGITANHAFHIGSWDANPDESANPRFSEDETRFAIKESLHWRKQDEGSFRIFYQLHGPDEESFGTFSTDYEWKPLLETKVSARRRAHVALPKFLKDLAQAVTIPDPEAGEEVDFEGLLSSEEIPF